MKATVLVNGKEVPVTVEKTDNLIKIILDKEITVQAGETIDVSFTLVRT
jgi:hypothetical protein